MNILTAENLTKVYTERKIFDAASFSIQDGEKIGLIGINGTGKSTLLRLAAGLEQPDEGEVVKGSQVNIRFLSQNPVFKEGQTVLEAVLDGNQGKEEDWTLVSQAKSILNRLSMGMFEQKTEHLSGGQKKRVALANVLLSPADLLILDEPTNHLDNEMAQWLEDYLKKMKKALLMVTHDRYFLDRVATRILEIDKGNIYSYPGNYSEFLRLKTAREDIEQASERKRQTLLRTELSWLARGVRGRGTKQKAHISRVMDLKERTGPAEDGQVAMSSVASRLGNKTLEADGIGKSFGGRTLIKDFSYIFLKGDRIGIVGPNGCGKTTLLKILTGNLEADTGVIEQGQTVKIGYFSQENEYMDESLKAIEYIRLTGEYIKTPEGTVTAAQMLERFLFDKSMQWSVIKDLSGGEKRRLYLCHILMRAPNILILDEPTNDLDIQTLQILEDYLDTFGGIVITVSHDRYFLDRVVRRIFAFRGDGRIEQYEGGFSDYLETVADMPEEILEKEQKQTKEKSWKDNSRQKLKFTYKEKQEYETIEEDVARLEAKIEEMEEGIAESATNYTRLNELMAQKEEAEKLLEEKMDRWVYLEDLAERIEQEKLEG